MILPVSSANSFNTNQIKKSPLKQQSFGLNNEGDQQKTRKLAGAGISSFIGTILVAELIGAIIEHFSTKNTTPIIDLPIIEDIKLEEIKIDEIKFDDATEKLAKKGLPMVENIKPNDLIKPVAAELAEEAKTILKSGGKKVVNAIA